MLDPQAGGLETKSRNFSTQLPPQMEPKTGSGATCASVSSLSPRGAPTCKARTTSSRWHCGGSQQRTNKASTRSQEQVAADCETGFRYRVPPTGIRESYSVNLCFVRIWVARV